MKTAYLLRGIPGSGKTKLACQQFPGAEELSADQFPGLRIPATYEIAADQFPGLKESHTWCLLEFEAILVTGKDVVLHNTNIKRIWLQPYLDLCKKYGYVAQVIHCEAVMYPDGSLATSINTPPSVAESMRLQFEPMLPTPKLGMTMQDVANELEGLGQPTAIALDMDGTIKRTRSGGIFPKSPDDFVLNKDLIHLLQLFPQSDIPVYILSNQRGVETGDKSRDFLAEELRLLNESLQRENVSIEGYFMAHTQSQPSMLVYLPKSDDFNEIETPYPAYKPQPGMLASIGLAEDTLWFIGDGHTDEHSADWQAVLAYRKEVDEVCYYIPIELAKTVFEQVF